MTGCASLSVPSTTPTAPANSTTKCSAVVKDGKYKTFGDLYEKYIGLLGQYGECATKHNGLVDYLGKK